MRFIAPGACAGSPLAFASWRLRLINFAHGDVFMIGGYLANFTAYFTFFMPRWLAVVVAIALTTVSASDLNAQLPPAA